MPYARAGALEYQVVIARIPPERDFKLPATQLIGIGVNHETGSAVVETTRAGSKFHGQSVIIDELAPVHPESDGNGPGVREIKNRAAVIILAIEIQAAYGFAHRPGQPSWAIDQRRGVIVARGIGGGGAGPIA